MQHLENLVRILRRVETCSAIRGLKRDVEFCLALGHATPDELADLMHRAVRLKVIRERDVNL